MVTLEDVRSATGLCPQEMVVGVAERAVHGAVLGSYLTNLWRGADIVRDLIVADIRSALDLGVAERAADLLLVLRLFLTTHPEAALATCPCERDRCEPYFDAGAGCYKSACPNVMGTACS